MATTRKLAREIVETVLTFAAHDEDRAVNGWTRANKNRLVATVHHVLAANPARLPEEQLNTAREIVAQMSGLDSDQWSDEQDRSDYFEAVADLGVNLAKHVLAQGEES